VAVQIFLRFQQKAWGQKETSAKYRQSEAPRPQGAASGRGSFLHIVPLDPAYPAGSGTGHVPAKDKDLTPEPHIPPVARVNVNVLKY
jgi:hypothetical protein